MAAYYYPTLMQKSKTDFTWSHSEGAYNGAREAHELTQRLNAGLQKQCLSCGARTNSKGQLPCGH